MKEREEEQEEAEEMGSSVCERTHVHLYVCRTCPMLEAFFPALPDFSDVVFDPRKLYSWSVQLQA